MASKSFPSFARIVFVYIISKYMKMFQNYRVNFDPNRKNKIQPAYIFRNSMCISFGLREYREMGLFMMLLFIEV